MRVVIAHDYLSQRGGAERVALALTRCFPDAPLVTSVYAPSQTFPEFRDVRVITSRLNENSSFRNDPRKAFPFLARSFATLKVPAADVVICSSSGWSHGLNAEAPKVVYCHNPARWLYQPDDYFRTLPAPLRRVTAKALEPLRAWDRRAALTANRYLANSTQVKERIVKTYGIHAKVVHPPSLISLGQTSTPVPGVTSGYALVVARSRGYKNTDLVKRAMAHMPGLQLVVAGGGIKERRQTGNVLELPRVADSQLRWLYENARYLVGASHEDFGLTPIEANTFGTPVLALRSGGYLDSIDEGVSGIFFDDLSIRSITRGMRVIGSRNFARSRILRHADKFSLNVFETRIAREAELAIGACEAAA